MRLFVLRASCPSEPPASEAAPRGAAADDAPTSRPARGTDRTLPRQVPALVVALLSACAGESGSGTAGGPGASDSGAGDGAADSDETDAGGPADPDGDVEAGRDAGSVDVIHSDSDTADASDVTPDLSPADAATDLSPIDAATDVTPLDAGAGETDLFHDGGGDSLFVRTERADGGLLTLRTNFPSTTAACALPGGPDRDCADDDRDGLADIWEQIVLERFHPLLRMDEAESLFGDDEAVVSSVGRIYLVRAAPLLVRGYIMLGYSRDYGSCGLTSHNGDSERVGFELGGVTDGDAGDVELLRTYTAAHENTISDHSRVFSSDEARSLLVYDADPETGEPRWVVFPSADKHGTYATIDICENISFIPCFDEDCAPDDVGNPADFDLLPPVANAGEESAPMLTDLGPIGFPGDDAWADQDFCGGRSRSNCSAPVREKLLPEEFE